MQSTRITVLTLLLFMGFIVPSCEDDGVDCSGCANSIYFDVEGMRVDLMTKDTDGAKSVITEDSLLFAELEEIYIDYEVDYHASVPPQFHWSFSLMNTASACTCIPGAGGSKTEKLTALSIITVNEYDTEHPAGSEIHDLLDYYGSAFDPIYEGIPLPTVLAGALGELLDSEDLLLKLTKAPTMGTDFQLKIVLELSTGEKYEAESIPFYLAP